MKLFLFLKCRYNLGRAVPSKRWPQYIWTKEDHEEFYKMFDGKIAELNKTEGTK